MSACAWNGEGEEQAPAMVLLAVYEGCQFCGHGFIRLKVALLEKKILSDGAVEYSSTNPLM